MDLKLIATTFSAIFIAEMGDKTQIAAFALASGPSSKMSVFVGASLALIATTAIAVLAGGIVGRYLPEIWIKRAGGAVFIVLGILMLLSRPSAADGPDEPVAETAEVSAHLPTQVDD